MRQFFSLTVLATLTGVIVGVSSLCFLWLIELVFTLFYGSEEFASTISSIPVWQRLLAPTLGGFLVGLLVTLLERTDIAGEGVPNVLEAVTKKRSRLALFAAPLKILTTALTLGSGGSAGKEGPIVQIGATLGASVGIWTKQKESTRHLLLAAGAAAGIAGVFSAPLAGIVFSAELILKKLNVLNGIVIALAASVSFGFVYIFGLPELSLTLSSVPATDFFTLILSVPLAVLAGGLAVLFGFILFLTTVLFHHYPAPAYIPGTIGGFMVGMIGLATPYIHEPMALPLMLDMLSFASIPTLVIVGLIIAKIGATGITLGSGGSGGVFAPSLLIGVLIGTVYVHLLGWLGFADNGMFVALLLAGIAAFFAGVTHAPFTAAILLTEITNEPLVLPVVGIASFIGYQTAKLLHEKSVYTEHLSRHGSYLEQFKD